jgi:Ferritin-like
MFLERPEGMALEDADGLVAHGRAAPLMEAGEIVPRRQDFTTVGHLYRSIEASFHHLAQKFGERCLFVRSPLAQCTAVRFGWPELVAVTNLTSACRAIEEILEQGEGPTGQWRDAHFGKFVEILDEYLEMKQANPDFDPVRPVLVYTVRPGEHDTTPLITDAVTARCTNLFNVGYEILLQVLARYFAHTEESDAQLDTLAEVTMAVMFRVIKPLGDLITTLPAGPDYRGWTAGPSFELFYESDYLLLHRESAWRLLAERLREAAAFCEHIPLDALTPLKDALGPVSAALVEMADSLAGHFGDWGGVIPVTPTTESAEPPAKLTALLARATELATAAAESSGAVAGLLTAAEEVTRIAAAGSRTRKRIWSGRVNSVLSTLAAVAAWMPANGVTGPVDEVLAGSVPERLWQLTRAATRLRIHPDAPPELVEAAAAALQHLAIQFTGTKRPDSPSCTHFAPTCPSASRWPPTDRTWSRTPQR